MDNEIDEFEDDEPEKGSNIKRILFVIFVIIPLIVFIILYTRNASFKAGTNRILAKVPGPIGRFFENLPTVAEDQERIDYLANYFLELDPGVAADKIYIIKEEDDKLYTNIIRAMNQVSVEETQDILLKVRNIDRRKDLLTSVYDDAKEDEKNKLMSEASRLESQDTLASKIEIERKFSSREFQEVLKNTDPINIAGVLYYVDLDIKNYVLDIFDSQERLEIEAEIARITNERNALKQLAKFYETKPVEIAVEALGNTDNYSMDKLSVIFKNMSVIKSAEILSMIDEDEFIEDLFSGIMKEEELVGSEMAVTRDISNAIEFLKEYQGKIKKLVKVYADMNANHVADIVEKMVANDQTITIFDIDMYERYELSDRIIIIDILSDLKRDQVSKVLDAMEPEKASQVTQLLAKPKERVYERGEEAEAGEVEGDEAEEDE